MADIFLSYSRADRARAEEIAKALEEEGFSVWWDKVLRAGQTYDEVTEGKLRDAKAVVVLWSNVSVKSKWVRAEATLGERSSAVIPAMIEADAERPILFELIQTADLSAWTGDREDENWKSFVADIRLAVDQRTDPQTAPSEAAAEAPDATIEITYWNSIKDGSEAADFESYLKRYPDGHFADLARNRISALSAAGAAPVPPPPETPKPAPPPAPPVAPEVAKPAPAAPPKPAPAPKPAPPKPAPQPQPTALKPSQPPEKKRGGRSLIYAAAALAAVGAIGVFVSGGAPGGLPGGVTIVPPTPETFADCDVCPVMQPIPAGSFQMGSPDGEPGGQEYERPVREVTVPAFALAATEVTFDQWDACRADGDCAHNPADRGFGRGGNPVIGVSYTDAKAYAAWLSRKTGRQYRLPSEAEWEYAARAGTTTSYWWGDAFEAARVPSDAPVEAESLEANPFGLKGMLGNATEWVEDCYLNSYDGAPDDGSPRLSSGDCSLRVMRGGDWESDAAGIRAANRKRNRAGLRDRRNGFRIATSDLEPR
ncbi:MAG: SUMF1/EgtB/PvdO family nonheme iron enzyme [Pseudomonadota bacterium]